jgi:hypothetical protein
MEKGFWAMDEVVHKAMQKSFREHFLGGADVEINQQHKSIKRTPFNNIVYAVKTMGRSGYWNRVNTVEAWGFATKIAIIFPGLLLGKQFWWLYIFAIISSVALIWTSTRKTLPTIILFNVAWVILASLSIVKHFWWF